MAAVTAEIGSRRALGRRIFVWGFPCSGKSTLASALQKRLGIDVIEMDALLFTAGWKMAGRDEVEARFMAAIARSPDGWLVDGNYPGISRLVLPQTDSVIWLDPPFHVLLYRILRRTAKALLRGDLALGHSRMDLRQAARFLWFFLKEQTRRGLRARQIEERLATAGHDITLIHLCTQRDVQDFLASLETPGRQRDQ